MATQQQIAALQQILNIAKQAGLNNDEQKSSVNVKTSTVNNYDAFNRKIAEICAQNNYVNTSFLMYCNIGGVMETNEKYGKIISEQLSNNVLSSIQSVITQFIDKYNVAIYRISADKTAMIIILNNATYNNKNEQIKILKDIGSTTQSMVFGACGQQRISFAISARKENEDPQSFTSRTDLLLKKGMISIAYDTEYFGNNNGSIYNDVALSVCGNEMITLCIGGAGTNIGNEWLQTMMKEHKIDYKSGTFIGKNNRLLDKINTYFDLTKSKYRPRSLFIDLDSDDLEKIKCGYLGSLIDIDIPSTNNMNHYWPQGHYTAGKEVFYNISDSVRGIAEICDNLQGFNVVHSINSGTGGGLTTLIQTALRDDYPTKININFSIYPHNNDNNHILSNYNSILTLSSLQSKTDIIFPINNDSLRCINNNNISFNDYNRLISLVLCGVTSPFRFYGEPEIVSNLQKMYYYFGVFPGAVHLTMAHSPFINKELSASQIKQQIISKINNISSSPKHDMILDGKILQNAVIYKCNQQSAINDLDNKLRLIEYKSIIDPMPFQSSLIYGESYAPIISTSIIHSTAIQKEYKAIKTLFKTNFNQKKMLSSFYDQGMDSYEFIEADKNIDALITKYNKLQNKKVIDDEKEDYDDEDD